MLKLVEPRFLSIDPYVPGRPIKLGAKLGSNENCLGPSIYALEATKEALGSVHLYPHARREDLKEQICENLKAFKIKASHVALGNGSSELIIDLVRALLSPQEAILYGWPSFVMYRFAGRIHGCKEIVVNSTSDMSFDLATMSAQAQCKSEYPVKLIFLANPNNPTGSYISYNILENFINNIPHDVVLVIDEAYFEYVIKNDYKTCLNIALIRPRTVILRTLSKAYGLAGIRLGYAVGDEEIIDILSRIRDPFNINIVAQYAAIAALRDQEHVRRSIEHNMSAMPILRHVLDEAGFKTHASVTNFIMAQRAQWMPPVSKICARLYEKGVVIRDLKNFGLENHVRISIGMPQEIELLEQALRQVL